MEPITYRPAVRLSDRQSARDDRADGRAGIHPNKDDPRTEARRDRDRILYSPAFSRLAGVTQVVTPSPTGFTTHNRLTHSLKVAQIARSIAEKLLYDDHDHEELAVLGGLDADVAEAAALAHDLGHPPFGHVGEEVLDEFARGEFTLPDGFEGNAQTFRIVKALDPRREDTGMRLTAATRAAVVKYPWVRPVRDPNRASESRSDRTHQLRWRKFGAYVTEYEALKESRMFLPEGYPPDAQTLEAAIMDVADDITYALHDLEDFYFAGVFTGSPALGELTAWQKAKSDHGEGDESPVGPPGSRVAEFRTRLAREYPGRFSDRYFDSAVTATVGHLKSSFDEPFDGSVAAIARVRSFVSQQIANFLDGLELNTQPTPDQPPLTLRRDYWHQIALLKELTRSFVVRRADMAAVQRGQQELLWRLLERMRTWNSHDGDRLPAQLLHHRNRAAIGRSPEDVGRTVVDYVSGLSDHQAFELDRVLGGRVDTIVRGFMV